MMPKVEKAIHLDAFMLYVEMGGMSPAFVSAFVRKFGKSEKTCYRWQKDHDWKRRIKEPVDEAVEELQAEEKLNAEELISGFLDLCRTRMSGIELETGYIRAIFATAFEKIKTGKLKVDTISDLSELIRAESRLIRDEQNYMRLVMMLIGKPEQIFEERIIVELVGMDEDVFANAEQAVFDTATEVRAGDDETENKA